MTWETEALFPHMRCRMNPGARSLWLRGALSGNLSLRTLTRGGRFETDCQLGRLVSTEVWDVGLPSVPWGGSQAVCCLATLPGLAGSARVMGMRLRSSGPGLRVHAQ